MRVRKPDENFNRWLFVRSPAENYSVISFSETRPPISLYLIPARTRSSLLEEARFATQFCPADARSSDLQDAFHSFGTRRPICVQLSVNGEEGGRKQPMNPPFCRVPPNLGQRN